VVADTRVEDAPLDSVRLVNVRSRNPLWWRARLFRALLWPLFARLALSQLATVVAGSRFEGPTLASDRLVGVDQPGTVVVVTTAEGAVLASVRSVGVGSGYHCGGGHDR
jgi:hypothetical protein